MLSEVYLEEINDHINNSTMHPLRRRMMKEMLAEIKALRRVAEAAEGLNKPHDWANCMRSHDESFQIRRSELSKALEAWRKGGD